MKMKTTIPPGRPRRRRVLIDPMQYRFLSVHLTFTGLIIVLFVGLMFGPLVVQYMADRSAETMEENVAWASLLLSRAWLPLLINVFCAAGYFIYLSHQVAGPLFQFRRLFGAVRDGNLTVRAGLRPRDFLRREEELINEMIEGIGSRVAVSEAHATELVREVKALRLAVDAGAHAKVSGELGRVESRSADLIASLRQFTIRHEEEEDGAPSRSRTEEPDTPPAAWMPDSQTGAAFVEPGR